MAERLGVREILNQANEDSFQHFGKLVAPALVAGFLSYWVSWSNSWLQQRLSYAVWHHAHGNVNAAIRGVVLPGVVLRLVMMGAEFMVWGAAFAVISAVVISAKDGESGSLSSAFRSVVNETGMLSLLWRLCWRLVLSGYLVMIASGAIGYWFLTRLHINLLTPRGRFCSEIFSLLVFGFVYVVFVRRFTLAIPLPLATGEASIDPFPASRTASLPWRVPIIVSCLLVLAISNLGDLHLPSMLLGPELIRPSVTASYAIWVLVSLVTSVPWAWLFVFLTRVAIVSAPELVPVAEASPAPLIP
jgi:hypothetical protein